MVASRLSFFQTHALPVLTFLSYQSQQVLEHYLATGNRSYREQLLLEFFRSTDWLSFDELRALKNNPLRRLEHPHQVLIYQDLKGYFNHKARQREVRYAQRKSHQLKVFDYFREKVPPQDKHLLERLRDFELEVTGRDQNWQHYFAMRSFKRINAFLAMPPFQRKQLITRFKQDVLAYKKNVERWHQYRQGLEYGSTFQFDDWCESNEDLSFPTPPIRALGQDLAVFGLPPEASLAQVKKRFRQLTLSHHPDVTGGSDEKMKRLLAAYERLKRGMKTSL